MISDSSGLFHVAAYIGVLACMILFISFVSLDYANLRRAFPQFSKLRRALIIISAVCKGNRHSRLP